MSSSSDPLLRAVVRGDPNCPDGANLAKLGALARAAGAARPADLSSRVLEAIDQSGAGDAEARRVRVHFLTPTDLRGVVADVAEGSTIAGPSFGLLVRRARDRLSALATFFGTGPLEHDAKGLGELADRTSLVEAHVSRTSIARRSTRTGERHAIGGWVGSALYEGPTVAAAMPWLRLAEALGVGKHATFGNGRIAVEVI